MHGESTTAPDGRCSNLGLPCTLSVILGMFPDPSVPISSFLARLPRGGSEPYPSAAHPIPAGKIKPGFLGSPLSRWREPAANSPSWWRLWLLGWLRVVGYPP